MSVDGIWSELMYNCDVLFLIWRSSILLQFDVPILKKSTTERCTSCSVVDVHLSDRCLLLYPIHDEKVVTHIHQLSSNILLLATFSPQVCSLMGKAKCTFKSKFLGLGQWNYAFLIQLLPNFRGSWDREVYFKLYNTWTCAFVEECNQTWTSIWWKRGTPTNWK